MVPNFRFPSDHDFGFDITRPANWQKFLENYKLDGLLLPRKTVEGHYIVYQVYDTSSKMKDGGRNRSLFPGYREDGTKLDVWKYGYLK